MNILIIEKDATLNDVYKIILSNDYTVYASTHDEYIMMMIPKMDVVLSAYNIGLPFEGVAIKCKQCKVPLVLASAQDVRVNVQQRLMKPFSEDQLKRAIKAAVECDLRVH